MIKHKLCFDIDWKRLKLLDCSEIVHSLEGDPMHIFKIKRKDTAPSLRAQIVNDFGEPVYLTANNPIKFLMKESFYFKAAGDEELKIENSENISLLDQNLLDTKGGFEYNWVDSDTDTEGVYVGEFQILLNGVESSAVETFELANNDTLIISVDGAANSTVTFLTADFADIAAATAAEVVTRINTDLGGSYASVSEGGKVLIQSLTLDTSGSIKVVGGTANNSLLFPVALVNNKRISLPDRGLEIRVLRDLDNN